ncbi:MAG: metalloregulator ArsR/SmtB family transcription factor [Candidatus Latescibacteria bacterium]|nr:metalloregulator ArsR/SmtB family transcription factor [Candidatus Latescibacterota bacterium]
MADPLKVYKALADATRLRLVRLLGRGALNVNEIIEVLQMGQSRISRHLKILAEAGLVHSRREGTWSYYQANHESDDPLLAEILGLLQRHEQGLPAAEADLQALERVVERRKAQTRRFFDSIQDPREFPQHQRLDGAFYRQAVLALLPEECGVTLDLGTGVGLLLPALQERASRVIAVDSSTAMLDLARQTAGLQAGRCEFRLGDLEHLPVADGEVDTAVACMVLHHLSDPTRALAEAHRALREGGELVIVDLHEHQDESLRQSMADLWLGFRPGEVKGWLGKLGFELTQSQIISGTDPLQLITFRGRKSWRRTPAAKPARAKRTTK